MNHRTPKSGPNRIPIRLSSLYAWAGFRDCVPVVCRIGLFTVACVCILVHTANLKAKARSVGEKEIDGAIQCYVSLNYGCTIEKLAPLLAEVSEQNDPVVHRTVRLYFALALVGADRHEEAEPHFRTLLTREPQLKLDPKQHSARAIVALESVRKTMIEEALPWTLDPGESGSVSLVGVPAPGSFELSEPRVAPRPTSTEFLPWIADLGVISSFSAADVGDYGVGFGMRLALQRYFGDYFAANIAVSATHHAGSADSRGQALWLVGILGSGGVSFSVAPWARIGGLVTAGAVPVGLGSFGDDVSFGVGGSVVARFRLAGAFGLSIMTSVLWVRGEWPGTSGNALFVPTCLSASFSF